MARRDVQPFEAMAEASPARRGSALGKVGMALAAGAAGVAWEGVRRADKRKLLADPEWAELEHPIKGRPQKVTAPDGTELHAEVFGPEDAPSIVLVHGWTC